MSAAGELLSFTLGPVQSFIAGARTVRDLWTGSYLLSWLTFAAMRPVIEEAGPDAFVTPHIKGLPLYERFYGKKAAGFSDDLLVPCLPNRFLAVVPESTDGPKLAARCEAACRAEWREIEQAVRRQWGTEMDPLGLWNPQVRDLFEIACVTLPLREVTPARTQELLGTTEGDWSAQLDLVSGLLAASRSVRHVPVYPVQGTVPQKCTLLGTYEQLGPATLRESREFWSAFAKRSASRGSRVGPRERLCAVSLVKRFAWSHYFSTEKQFNCPTRSLRFADTATTAARRWLETVKFPEDLVSRSDWSGAWLHWMRPDQDADEPCPEDVWAAIRQARTAQREKPPAYYAILMLDGDRLGKTLREAGDPDRCRNLSAILTKFARTQVPAITAAHSAELIYTGGDDVLAILPAQEATACARKLEAAYRQAWQEHVSPEPTLSGGLVLAHYKEDLRFALQEARDAERNAKEGGRNALTVRTLRRSGEHTEALVGWDQIEAIEGLVTQFAGGFSDRWVYRLRAELPTLTMSEVDPNRDQAEETHRRFRGEVNRLLDRAENAGGDPEVVRAETLALLDGYTEWGTGRNFTPTQTLTNFVTLVQSAAFLARGREE